VQPVLWLIIFGETFNRLHAIATGRLPDLDFLAPGVLAQSTLFISIFYGIQSSGSATREHSRSSWSPRRPAPR
jgi:hypothetical protein